jgi:hypothetical protein
VDTPATGRVCHDYVCTGLEKSSMGTVWIALQREYGQLILEAPAFEFQQYNQSGGIHFEKGHHYRVSIEDITPKEEG